MRSVFLLMISFIFQNFVFMHLLVSQRHRYRRLQTQLLNYRRKNVNASIQRQRRYLQLKKTVMFTYLATKSSVRRTWAFPRIHGKVFWGNILNNFDDGMWMQHFRMSRNTFEFVLQLLSPSLKRKTTGWRKPLEPRLRLAVVLWWYATPSEYRTISCLFGLGISTVCMLVRQVTNALKTLCERFICLPKGERLQKTIDGFFARGYKMCAGAIDGCHIPILKPHVDQAAYCNRKGWHSIVLQAVVDHNFCFTDVYVGWPGRTHDARVLANSPIYQMAEAHDGYLFPREKSTVVDGVEVPIHLIGDAAYPLKKWLMKGFLNHQILTPDQSHFNFCLSSARMVVENSFGRLKGRWRCLLKRNDVDINIMSDIVVACCILHNICELRKERYLPEWNTDLQCDVSADVTDREHNRITDDAQAVRRALVSLLS